MLRAESRRAAREQDRHSGRCKRYAPVEPDFNAIVRPKLENRAAVGRLSDQLNALGKLKGVHETTAKDVQGGRHRFNVEFEKATWVEDLVLDSDGKVAAFHIRPPSADAASGAQ